MVPQSFTVVVRQGDNVAALHVARPFDDPKAFDPKNGRWELKGAPRPEVSFETEKNAVVSAVVIPKREPAGLETLSWVQPVSVSSSLTILHNTAGGATFRGLRRIDKLPPGVPEAP